MTQLLLDNLSQFLPTHSPWDTAGGDKELTTCVFLRGSILSSYGYAETLLNDLALAMSKVPELYALSPRLPRVLGERLEFLQRCFAECDLLAPISADSIRMIDSFAKAQPDRNDWAHARMIVLPGSPPDRWGSTTIKLEMCSPKTSHFQVRTCPIAAGDLIEHAKSVREMAQESQLIHWQAMELLSTQ